MAASLIAAFGHIHTEVGTPTLGAGSTVWGLQRLFLGGNKGPIIQIVDNSANN